MKSAMYSIVSLSILLLSGCTYTATSTDQLDNLDSIGIESVAYSTVNVDGDFTPPTGRPLNPPPASAGERRLMTATSTDGLTFTTTGNILTDQGNVPDLVITEDGTVQVYYIGQSIEAGKEESTVMASSTDNGETWTFHLLEFNDLPQPRDPSDPDVVLLDDGTYRMYYTSSLSSGKLGIVYATSPDGIHFTYGGESLEGDVSLIDSSTFFYGDRWHMFTLQETTPGQVHATSTDGLHFELTSPPELVLPLEKYVASNPIFLDGQVGLYAFNLPENNLRLFTSPDLETWTAGEVVMTGDDATTLGTNYLQDSSAVQLQDGTYLMVYVTELPAE
jgi:hypothetical protein